MAFKKEKKDKAEPKPPKRDENGKRIFTEKSGLGFMRVIQVWNALSIVLTLVSCFFMPHSSVVGAPTLLLVTTVFIMFAQSVAIWLIANRKKCTRVVVPILYAFIYVCLVADKGIDGIDGFISAVIMAIPYLICSLYLIKSRRAKAVLVRPFDVEVGDRNLDTEGKIWNPRSSEFWMHLAIYFFAFSIMGHWMERGLQVLIKAGLFPGTIAAADSLTNRDMLNPFFIYGIAVVFCGLVLFPIYVKLKEKMPSIWQAFAISFVINGVFCVGAEVILGLLCNADYHAWDYRDQFLNWEGQVCFLYSFAFTVAASVITWLVYPGLERLFSYIGRDTQRIIFVCSAVFFAFTVVAYNVDLTPEYEKAGIDTSQLTVNASNNASSGSN